MSTMTLTDFLLARIAEDEEVARAASPGGWQFGGVDSVAGGTLYDETRRIADLVYEQPTDHDGTITRHLLVTEADANGAHIARHDPGRVLAECEALRRIVAMEVDARHDDAYVHAVRALAAVYADHPDYREEWRH